MHTTLSITQLYKIADPGKQNTLLLGNYTANSCTISHHDGDICSYHYDTSF